MVKYQIRKEGNLPRHAAAGGEVAGDWVKKKKVEGGRRLVQGSPPSSFFIYFIFLSFRVSGNGLLLGSLLLGFLSNRPLLLFSYPKICIYSARVPSRVRNQVSIKLILFFEV